jgi:hypothetical protein
MFIEAVQRVACGHACLAPAAAIQIDFKSELLSVLRQREGDEVSVVPGFERAKVVRLGKRGNGGQLPLVGNNLVQ